MTTVVYIPAVLTSHSRTKVEALSPSGKITKAAIRQALLNQRLNLEFISRSHFHRYGAYFSLAQAMRTYGGSVGVEVRTDTGALIAVVMACEGEPIRVD